MYVRLHIKSAVDQPVISRCPDKMGWDSVVSLGGDGYLKMKGNCWSQRQTMTDYIFQGWPQHSSIHMFFPSHPICSFHPICSSHPIPDALPTQYVAVFPSTGAFSTWPQWVGYAIAWQAEYDKQFPGTDLGGPSAFSSWPLEILALERPMHGTQSLLSHLPRKYEDSPTPGYCTKHIPQGETQEKETSCREELAHMQQRHHSREKRKKSPYRVSVGR